MVKQIYNIRLEKRDYDLIKSRANAEKLNFSEWVRRRILSPPELLEGINRILKKLGA